MFNFVGLIQNRGWGLGIGPNPQSPIPNSFNFLSIKSVSKYIKLKLINFPFSIILILTNLIYSV